MQNGPDHSILTKEVFGQGAKAHGVFFLLNTRSHCFAVRLCFAWKSTSLPDLKLLCFDNTRGATDLCKAVDLEAVLARSRSLCWFCRGGDFVLTVRLWLAVDTRPNAPDFRGRLAPIVFQQGRIHYGFSSMTFVLAQPLINACKLVSFARKFDAGFGANLP